MHQRQQLSGTKRTRPPHLLLFTVLIHSEEMGHIKDRRQLNIGQNLTLERHYLQNEGRLRD
jgi:hypothetical protein